MRRWFLPFALALCLSGSVMVSAHPDTDLLGFAPPDTDSLFYSDLAALEKILSGQGGAPPATGALAKLRQLLDETGIPREAFAKAGVLSVCTFHVRGTDHQLVLFTLAGPPVRKVREILEKRGALIVPQGARYYVLWSRTKGLAQSATWSSPSHLSPGLLEDAQMLVGKPYWSVIEFDETARLRLEHSIGAQGELPEVRRLRSMRFDGAIIGVNKLRIHMVAVYPTDEDATQFGGDLGTWMPFKERMGSPDISGSLVSFKAEGVTYNQLAIFLGYF